MSALYGHRQSWRYPLLVALVLLLTGCYGSGDGLPRQPVAGTVLVDGRRLEYGSIMFYPEDSIKRDDRAVTGDVIVNGRFSIPRERGPSVGLHKIVVDIETKKRQKSRTELDPGPETAQPVVAEHLPPRFNTQTELEVEIKEGGIKNLKLELASK